MWNSGYSKYTNVNYFNALETHEIFLPFFGFTFLAIGRCINHGRICFFYFCVDKSNIRESVCRVIVILE